jgi:NarL family two-component system response regulator LiaR
MTPIKIRIMIADDHPIVREGMAAILSAQPDMELVGEASDGAQAVTLALQTKPDVILLDLEMPFKDGVAVIREVRDANLQARILVLTSYGDDDRVFPAIKNGALGYMLKDTPREHLLQAIRDVARGQAMLHPTIALKVMSELLNQPSNLPLTPSPLTGREMDTLRLVARGFSNQEIAIELGIHEYTVAKHVGSILDKLQLANRTQAALYALREGLAKLD